MDLQLAITLKTKRKLSWKKKNLSFSITKGNYSKKKKKSEIKSLVNQ